MWNPATLLATAKAFGQKLLQRPSPREIESKLTQSKNRIFTPSMFLLIIRETFFQIDRHDLNTKSAALTYSCILALGPLLATAFFFFQIFNGFDILVNKTLVPLISAYFSEAASNQLKEYLNIFVQNFRPGVLGSVAIATFLVTVIGLLSSIEKAVNNIFSVEIHRPLWRQSLNYWLLLSVTPFILVFSSSKTAEFLKQYPMLKNAIDRLSFLGLPLTITAESLGFALLFYILPNRKISLKSLLVGGFAAGIMFRLLQGVNVILTKNLLMDSTATQLYGTAPIIAVAFFFWIKLAWMVILIGACLSAGVMRIEEIANPNHESEAPINDLLLCSAIFAHICHSFRDTGEGISCAMLHAELGSELEGIARWTKWLEKRNAILSAEIAATTIYLPTQMGLDLEREPLHFVERILLPRPPDGTVATPTSSLPFVQEVCLLLKGNSNTEGEPRNL